ncbi:hypothetical protein GH741_03065 [Aquibacillus halophilus]|uniref:Uncharacterized protein n=1 Tax=Aquibacillus halophilus TaxID=930132 RepID=A0A6A8DK74_9BACI|nr:hypothetical protein [Aquibacillus halophilus]MRH41652.1 hypothetical protein [Aquibacillus halophilus]
MSKRESQLMFQIFSEFINGLNHEQYESLVNGNAVIEYKRTNTIPIDDRLKDSILKSEKITDVERYFKGSLKKDIILFCESNRINVKGRDTKKEMFKKIANHFNIDYQESKDVELNEVMEKFLQLTDGVEAKQFLTAHETLKTKKEIIQFAQLLDVYVNPRHSKVAIVDRIIESVIGSQLRAKVIRS